MKFEKFLKSCGTHGQIVKRENGDKWLVCGGVGMKVPDGIVNLLGSGEAGILKTKIIEAIVTADTDDKVHLTEAYIPADGKASDIVRIFGNGIYEVGIRNADFGLLEKADYNLAYLEIEIENEKTDKFLLVLNRVDEVIGFIGGGVLIQQSINYKKAN